MTAVCGLLRACIIRILMCERFNIRFNAVSATSLSR